MQVIDRSRLKIAKDLRCLSNKDFANLLGCSEPKIRKILTDENYHISHEDFSHIMEKLNLPASFFSGEDNLSLIQTCDIFYRSAARIKAEYRNANEAYTLLAKKINFYFEQKLTLPKFSFPELEIFESDHPKFPSNIANNLRGFWGLGIQPINNIIALLELKGFRVFRLPFETKQMDALSFFDDQSGNPFVFLNDFKSFERQRFDAAHELGHMIMHKDDKAEYNRTKESEADQFASEFLMPYQGFISKIPSNLSIQSMIEYKKQWRVSLKAINYRSHKLDLISDWNYKNNSIRINSYGYHINEPEPTHRDHSLLFTKILKVLSSEHNFSINKMLDEMGISKKDFNDLTFNSLETLEFSKIKPKLYLVE